MMKVEPHGQRNSVRAFLEAVDASIYSTAIPTIDSLSKSWHHGNKPAMLTRIGNCSQTFMERHRIMLSLESYHPTI